MQHCESLLILYSWVDSWTPPNTHKLILPWTCADLWHLGYFTKDISEFAWTENKPKHSDHRCVRAKRPMRLNSGRFVHVFIHLLKLAVPNAEAVAASIPCVTAAVAAHPWTSVMGCSRPRNGGRLKESNYIFITSYDPSGKYLRYCREGRKKSPGQFDAVNLVVTTSTPAGLLSPHHNDIFRWGITEVGTVIKTPRSRISITRPRLGEFSLFASQLLTRQRQADYQLESGRLDGSLAILSVAIEASLAIFGLWRTPLDACHRQSNP